ncbi:MAG: hypothetical protein KC425_06760, partial [Anaerolineales bacterium]|nr:hypothetical protein [Anaerolineales bacterium]
NPRIFYNDARAALDDVRGMQDTAVSLIPADRPTAAPKPETALPAPRTTLSISGVYTRTEQDDPAIVTSGTWQTLSTSPGSGGSYMRSNTAGSSASFSFSGPWVAVGLLGDRFSGDAEIFIDGVSQGVVSTYRRETTPFSLHFSGLADTNHVISVTVVGTAVPQALSTYVYVDYVDVWNGTPPADGRFEENDPRVILSSSARFANSPVASGGAYAFRTDMTTWFPFHGDSFSYQAFAYTGGGLVQLSVDGQFLTTVDLFNWTQITRTFSFTGFTPGMHLLQVTGFYGNNTVDVMATPGTPPFTDPNPPPGAFTRYEAHHPDFRYNGLPFPSMGSSWTRTTASAADASGGQVIESFTIGDVASLTFNGSWASIGFGTGFGAGQAEVFLDGVSQGILDLYRREDGVTSLTLGSIGAGTHTISATVLGGGDLRIDYVDVWDGTPLPDGTFDWEDGRFYLSDTWFRTTNAGARGGDFLETDRGTVWFPFSGDTVSFESFFTSQLKSARLYVDDAYVGTFDLSGSSAPTPTLSLDGLGSGVHVLRVEHYRGRLSLNAFRTPGTAPFIQPPPPPSGFTRIEEDADDWLYNGLPYTQTVTSWSRVDNIFSSGASDGQYMQTSAVGNTAVYTINGASFGVGFVGERRGGQAEIFIDGVSQGVIDTFRQDITPLSAYFHGLPNTTHTISITLLSTAHPNVGGSPTLYFDYLDVWDGTPLPDGFFEEDDSRVFRSPAWYDVNDAGASGGAYVDTGLNADSNMWFPFEGDSVTFQAMAFPSGARDAVRVWVDGVPQGVLNLYSQTPVTRPVSFGGFGPGLHVLTIERYQGETTVDGFAAPGTAPFYQPPTFTGLVRYEEDGGDILYNGYHYALRPTTWNASFPGSASERGIISSSTPGDTASLTFYGSWFNLGMRTRSNYGTAEIFVDGVSQGVITLTAPVEGPISFPFGGFITGTHALSVTVLSGAVVLDYVDVWDGTPVSDDFLNARMTEQNGRIHFGSGIGTYANPDAIDGDYSAVTLLNTPGNVWYTFVGDSFTYYAFSRTFGGTAEVYVDGVYTATVDLDYDFSEMPLAFHFTGLPYGPHVVRIKNGLNMRVDGFAANPQSLASYQPMVEWSDDTPAGNGAPFFGTVGIAASIAAGDVTGDGTTDSVIAAVSYVDVGTPDRKRGEEGNRGDGDGSSS